MRGAIGGRLSRNLLGLVAAGAMALPAAPSAAEGFFDLYAGAVVADDAHIRARILGATNFQKDLELTSDPSVGIRGGYWFRGVMRWLGLGIDLSYYRSRDAPDDTILTLHTASVTPMLMLRLPLFASEAYPNGRLQPYAAGGPALALTDERFNTSAFTGYEPDDSHDVSADLGADGLGGIAFHLTRRVALFAEYRFSYLEPDIHDDFGFTGDVDADVTLRRHHVLGGVSFRF